MAYNELREHFHLLLEYKIHLSMHACMHAWLSCEKSYMCTYMQTQTLTWQQSLKPVVSQLDFSVTSCRKRFWYVCPQLYWVGTPSTVIVARKRLMKTMLRVPMLRRFRLRLSINPFMKNVHLFYSCSSESDAYVT